MKMSELWNDVLYTDVMHSNGYDVDYAVLTTYSLDMPSLLSVPFLLGTMSDLSESAMKSPHLILESINRSAGKFAVFCNVGSIAVPQQNSKVYALLERSVVQVNLPAKGNGFINFHPKVWIIKESNSDTGDRQLKVVVLSRNLTSSNDLDVVCELVGKINSGSATDTAKAKHKPLSDFLRWLCKHNHNHTSREIRKNIKEIINDIQHIECFDLKDSPFDDYDFFPMGIDNYNGIEQCLKNNMLNHASEMVVISPFIDAKTLEMMVKHNSRAKKTLITRYSSLDNEILKLFNDGVYVPKEVLTDNVEKDMTVDLHEKVYFVHDSFGNNLYLGSTNATQNGFGRNVEFLLRLRFTPYKISYDRFREEFIHDNKDCLFEKVNSIAVDTIKEDYTNELDLRKAISAISNAKIYEYNKSYNVLVNCCKEKLPQSEAYLYPMGCESVKCTLTENIMFTCLDLSKLTEFYVIGIGDIKRVIKIDTIGLPIAERDKAVFRSIVDTKSKFISYLAFMLTDDVEQYILESQQLEKELANGNIAKEQEISISLYEDMLRMAYSNPDRVTAIRSIMEKADASVIPDSFGEMYAAFEKAIKKIVVYEQFSKRFSI